MSVRDVLSLPRFKERIERIKEEKRGLRVEKYSGHKPRNLEDLVGWLEHHRVDASIYK